MSEATEQAFDDLLVEAAHRRRMEVLVAQRSVRTVPLSWDYTAIVSRCARRSSDMLDMDTGGGEWLAAFPDRPPRTLATEAWAPHVPVAAARLLRIGVRVVRGGRGR